MQQEGWTILAPQMSPIHFSLLQPVFRRHGYHVEILDNDNRAAIDTGLKFVNNDACFPSITVVGQIMSAITSGKYDTDHLAVLMTPNRRLLPGQQLRGLHPPGLWIRRGCLTFLSSPSTPTAWKRTPASGLRYP